MRKIIFVTLVIFYSGPLFAEYNSNLDGVVKDIITYTNGTILFRMENGQPDHTVCNNAYFAIDPSTPADIRHQVLSRLMTAKAMKETIRIGYDGLGNCASGYIRAHRVG